MEDIKKELLLLIFDNDNKQIDKFEANKSFETDLLIDEFLSIFNVPYEKFIMKGDNKHFKPNTLSRIPTQKSVTKSSIFKIVKDILNGKNKDINKNKYRNLNPIFIILFYDLLEEEGYEFVKTVNNTIEIRHMSYQINYRIRETLKIFYEIFTNKSLISLLPNERIEMIKNFNIDVTFNDISYDYIDIYIRVCNQKILINIDKNKENHLDNFHKDCQVVAVTNEIVDHFYFNDESTKDFIKIINKRISQKIYKKNRVNSVAFYLTLQNIPPEHSLFFTSVYQNRNEGIKLKDLLKYLEDFGFEKSWNVFRIAIKNGDLSYQHFNCDSDTFNKLNIKKDKKKFFKIKLNLDGVTSVLNYPRKSDWSLAPLIKNYYSIFTKEYFDFISSYLENQNEKFKYLKEAFKINKKFKSIHEIMKISMLKFLQKSITREVEEKVKIKFHPSIPILVEEKGNKIDKKDLLERIYGLNLKLNQKINQHKNYDNNLYLDLKYRIDQNESKDYILNYRLIETDEIKKIFNL